MQTTERTKLQNLIGKTIEEIRDNHDEFDDYEIHSIKYPFQCNVKDMVIFTDSNDYYDDKIGTLYAVKFKRKYK